MIVRDATDADLPAVLDMAKAFCATTGEGYDKAHTLTHISGVRHGGFLLVAEQAGRVVGMIAAVFGPGLCSPDRRAHELCLWVCPGDRHGHALLLLLREFDRRAQASGVKGAQLSALENSPPSLQRIYRRMGYRPADSSFIKRFGSP